eukprot:646370-Hanusia_phi.AAC.1
MEDDAEKNAMETQELDSDAHVASHAEQTTPSVHKDSKDQSTGDESGRNVDDTEILDDVRSQAHTHHELLPV